MLKATRNDSINFRVCSFSYFEEGEYILTNHAEPVSTFGRLVSIVDFSLVRSAFFANGALAATLEGWRVPLTLVLGLGDVHIADGAILEFNPFLTNHDSFYELRL